LTVRYDTLEQLDDILLRLGHGDRSGPVPGTEIAAVKKKRKAKAKKPPKLSIGLKSSAGKKKKAS